MSTKVSLAINLVLLLVLAYILYTYWDEISKKQTFLIDPNEHNKFKNYDYSDPKDIAYVLNH